MSGNWLEWCLPEPEYHWATQSHTIAQHRNFCIYSWGAWGWGQLSVFMANRLRSFLWWVHIFSSWLPVNFSLPFKGTPQHLMKVIAHIQMVILMVSSPFGLLWCGARSRDSVIYGCAKRAVFLHLSFSASFQRSPLSLCEGFSSSGMHIHELPIF